MPDGTDRGRVPFAVVAVLLLVSASTLAATSRTGPTATTEPAAERAIERAEAAVVTALRRATREAARQSAARPLTTPADTPTGRALNGSDPFRAALELRVALALEDRLRHLDTRVGDVRVVARQSPRPSEPGPGASVRAALERVETTAVGPDGTALRATVRNVTLVVTRDGRPLDRVQLSPSVVVEWPLFALHERVERFERRLARSPLRPGFARRLTARLAAATWARGTAQYGGAPVVNVLGTRHVELLANGALLDTQRATLGGLDARAPRELREATRRVAAADVAGGVREALARSNGTVTGGSPTTDRLPDTRRRTVSAAPAADSALANLSGGRLDAVLARAYTATVRTRATVQRDGRTGGSGGPPGPGWSLVDRRVDTEWSARPLGDGVTPPDPATGWHGLGTATRRVVRTRTVTERWAHDGETRRTRHTDRATYAVALVHEGRPSRRTAAPVRPVRSAFVRRPDPTGGSNLADAGRTATRRFEARTDRLAVRAVREGLDGTESVAGEVPAALRDRALADLVSLHRRVRNVSVSVERGDLATLTVSPAARLADRLRERRADLVAAPARYDHVADRARVAVRAAYLDAVLASLDTQTARHGVAERRLDARLRAAGLGDLHWLREVTSVGVAAPSVGRESAGRAGPFAPRVSTTPVYLGATASSSVPGGAPLVTRNVNLAVPYADAGDGAAAAVTAALFDDRTVGLGTAARTLRSSRRVAARTGDSSLREETGRLRRAVNRSVGRVSWRLRRTLRRRGVGREMRRAAVRSAFARWDDPSGRALALSHGSVVPRVVDAVARRVPRYRAEARRLALRTALRATRRRALRSASVRVAARPVDRTGRRLRWVARTATREVTTRAVETGVGRLRERLPGPLSAVPAGVPVTPVPGYWYATANVWHVTVRGRYERVTLRAPTGRPPTGTLTYVREAGVVRLDVDRDGSPERLGRSDAVAFDVSTAVAVAVPPGPRGVGDKDGNADERSAGWPRPGAPDVAAATANETTYPPPS
ncbi:hypothetical protein N0B31_01445 [Salinirubellus salinus]|uniref:Uncharacterized protein n=1 Tax=Salinirubellus salinus TaxID=1364945 RepID=A0A9E7R5C1_9EURY|nr:hypothetical protein [Salinirubellus salinus]UWM54955.1 hypothetical protein N0B31_01445 [Salinirubellus salinus]